MKPLVVGAILARNEAAPDRFLAQCVASLRPACDAILLLDDGSTDGTPDLARALGCLVAHRHADTPAWGHEAPAREELWRKAADLAGPEGWVLVSDADQILVGADLIPTLAQTWEAEAWAWPLYDLWTPTDYREDDYWQGHRHPRPWMARVSAFPNPLWHAKSGLHVGHLPPGEFVAYVAPVDERGVSRVYWEHEGYSTPELRRRKYRMYMEQAEHLTPFQLMHAQSILDYDKEAEC